VSASPVHSFTIGKEGKNEISGEKEKDDRAPPRLGVNETRVKEGGMKKKKKRVFSLTMHQRKAFRGKERVVAAALQLPRKKKTAHQG